MNLDKSFIEGAAWINLGSIAYGANSVLMLATVSRVCTVEDTGCFGIAFTTAQLLYIIGLLGTNHYQQTDYAEKYSFYEYKKAKQAAILLMMVCCILLIAILRFSGNKIIYTILLTMLMALNAIGELYQSLFFQKNRLDLSGKSLFFRTVWSVSAFILCAYYSKSIVLAIIAQILLNYLITMYYAKKYVPNYVPATINVGAGVGRSRVLIEECFPLFLSTLLINLIINTSKYGVNFLMNDKAQGYFNMLFIVVQMVNMCSQFIFKPLLNRYYSIISNKQYRRLIHTISKQVLIVGGITATFMVLSYVAGSEFLGILYNVDLTSYRLTLVYIVAASGIYAVNEILYYVFVIFREQKRILHVYASGAIIAVALAYIMIVRWELNGAAFSFLFAQLGITVLYVINLSLIINNRSV